MIKEVTEIVVEIHQNIVYLFSQQNFVRDE